MTTPQMTLGLKPLVAIRPALLIARNAGPAIIPAAVSHLSTAALTHVGTRTVRTWQQSPFLRKMDVVVRTVEDPASVAPAVRRLISAIDDRQPVVSVKILEQSLSESILPRRFNMFLLGTFAATALLMALVGIYGVIAYSVTQRTHEIGVRMALGAQRGEVMRMVIWQGLWIVLAGISAGLIAAIGLTRLMASLLYDVQPTDAPTFVVVTGAMITALLAIWTPAFRAALVDPMIALHYE